MQVCSLVCVYYGRLLSNGPIVRLGERYSNLQERQFKIKYFDLCVQP